MRVLGVVAVVVAAAYLGLVCLVLSAVVLRRRKLGLRYVRPGSSFATRPGGSSGGGSFGGQAASLGSLSTLSKAGDIARPRSSSSSSQSGYWETPGPSVCSELRLSYQRGCPPSPAALPLPLVRALCPKHVLCVLSTSLRLVWPLPAPPALQGPWWEEPSQRCKSSGATTTAAAAARKR